MNKKNLEKLAKDIAEARKDVIEGKIISQEAIMKEFGIPDFTTKNVINL